MVNFFDTRIGRRVRDWKYNKLFSRLAPGEVAIDCGANVGKFTTKMAKPGVTVYAFEPDPHAFKVLESKFKDNTGVVLMNKAVSARAGRGKLYFDKRSSADEVAWSIRSTLLAEKPNMDLKAFFEVEIIDLAEFIQGIEKPIGLMKMDIEGAEVDVLNKLIDLGLTKRIRNIVVETHERFPTLAEPTAKLRERIRREGISNIDLDWA
ncbi:FkbM family methyltransferase [Candidatus Parcubacteria bacterium]|nr:FkbM family methyltransferase [Candidatus Parcubacteria bacterium]